MTTHNWDRSEELRAALGSMGELVVIEDAVSLLDELESDEVPQVIVIDCMDPTVQAATMLTLAGDLHPETNVVLWGASPAIENELLVICTAADSWLRAAPSMSAARIAALVEALSTDS
jgi:DNA-binding NtrC family response regulator